MTRRDVLLVVHSGRPEAVELARATMSLLSAAGLHVRLLDKEADEISPGERPASVSVVEPEADPAAGCELVIVLGGDGTLLRAAEIAHDAAVPVLGVNLGHVGFLAEAEPDDLGLMVERVEARSYTVEERLTLDVSVLRDGQVVSRTWALNEASVEKSARERMIELVVEIDGRPLSRWGCDGVVMATPTGSTAYAFSAGGPVVWPEVDALLLVPLSAHALFARPLVASPRSVLAVELVAQAPGAVLWCDGRRTVDVSPGDRIEVRRGRHPVRLARLHEAPFTDRLVAKFALPVEGWRGRSTGGASG